MERNDAHVAKAQSRLIEVLKSKPNVKALVEVLVAPLQELEGVFWDVLDLTDLEDATGEQMDVLGRVINQERAGLDDDTYRLWLRARVKLNRSSGTVPEIIEIFQLILPPGADVALLQEFPKAVALAASGVPLTADQAALYLLFLGAAVDAGVRYTFQWNDAVDAETFAFDGGNAGDGFGDTGDADTGGALSGIALGD